MKKLALLIALIPALAGAESLRYLPVGRPGHLPILGDLAYFSSGGTFTGGTVLNATTFSSTVTLNGTPSAIAAGLIEAPNGSAAAPSIVSSNFTTTGMFFPSAQQVDLSVSGVSFLDINGTQGAIRIKASQLLGWSSGDPSNTNLAFYWQPDHVGALRWVSTNSAPTVTANCGTSPTVTGNDGLFKLNVGTGGTATTCTITFNIAWGSAPSCFVNDETSQAVTTTAAPSTGTVILTATAAWTASSILDVKCERPN